MFTVLGTWEVIGEVQGERYKAVNIHRSGSEKQGGRSSGREGGAVGAEEVKDGRGRDSPSDSVPASEL